MTDAPKTVVHVLAVDQAESNRSRLRATVRIGTLSAGQRVWYETVDGGHRTLTIEQIGEGSRYTNLTVAGEHLADLEAGAYLYGPLVGD